MHLDLSKELELVSRIGRYNADLSRSIEEEGPLRRRVPGILLRPWGVQEIRPPDHVLAPTVEHGLPPHGNNEPEPVRTLVHLLDVSHGGNYRFLSVVPLLPIVCSHSDEVPGEVDCRGGL